LAPSFWWMTTANRCRPKCWNAQETMTVSQLAKLTQTLCLTLVHMTVKCMKVLFTGTMPMLLPRLYFHSVTMKVGGRLSWSKR
jgi:hypothetical protein